MYYNGLGVARDFGEAVAWFHKAIDCGYVVAMGEPRLYIYENCDDPKFRNPKKAVEYYRMAAKKGHEDAQKKLNDAGVKW